MLGKYYKFQVDRFFEDYRDNQKKLARLKEEREAELTSFSMDYSSEEPLSGQCLMTVSRSWKAILALTRT